MKAVHQRPIKDMSKVVIGIAEFDLKYHDYLEAGGRTIDDFELKQSLTNILPSDLRRELLFKVNLPEPYCSFSKAVRESTLTLLQHESRLPIHMIEAAQDHDDGDLGIDDFVGMIAEASGGEPFAIQQRFKKKFGANWRTNKPNNDSRPNNRKDSPTTNTARKDSNTRREDMCINCSSKVHKTNECPLPRDDSKRKCFTCGKPGHTKAQCPQNKASLKAVTNASDAQLPSLGLMGTLGFQQVKHGGTTTETRASIWELHRTEQVRSAL
jgi:hypothetical protein